MPRIHAQLDALTKLTEILQRRAPATLRAIDEAMQLHDGYPATSSGVPRTGGTAELTSVERAAHGISPLMRDHDRLVDAIRSAAAEIAKALSICDKWTPTVDASTLRCTGGAGLPGALESWGDATCTNIAEADRRGGLCMACRKRRDRWQRGRDAAA